MQQRPQTQTMKASKARQAWSQILTSVHRGEARVIVEKHGVPVAAIVSADDLEQMRRLETEREERFKALDATRAAFKDVPPEELEREVRKAIAAIRAENRVRRQQAQ